MPSERDESGAEAVLSPVERLLAQVRSEPRVSAMDRLMAARTDEDEESFSALEEQSGVYAIWCVPTRKCYVGSTKRCFWQRFKDHVTALDGDWHYNRELQKDYREHGETPGAFWFTILELCRPANVRKRECEWIKAYRIEGWLYDSLQGPPQVRRRKPPKSGPV